MRPIKAAALDVADALDLPIKAVLDNTDRLAVAVMLGELEPWQPTRPEVSVPGVPAGWTPDRWAARLRTLAAGCEPYHPGRAQLLRQEADRIETATKEKPEYPLAGIPG